MTPNILWICTDQQCYDTIAALGCEHVSTPNIDSLVASGTTFTHAYCQSPLCTPRRASFLTGMYASAVHVNGNGLEYFPDRPKLAPMLTGQVAPDHHQSCSICDGSKSTRRDRPRIQQPVLRTGPSRAPRSRPALH